MAKPELTEWDEDLTASADEEYDALVRALQWTKGFGLLFVQCFPAEGERLIVRVQGDITGKVIKVLRLNYATDDLFDKVSSFPCIDQTNVLFVIGLEKSLVPYIKPGYGSEGDYYAKDTVPKLLGKLNLQREKFRDTFNLCFVFLVPPYAMKYLIRRAADFYDWRSGVWELVGSPDEVQQKTEQVLQARYTEYLSWTPQQRRERLLEIEDLIAEGGYSSGKKIELYFEAGNLAYVDEQFEWAIASYDAALSIKPNDPEALYNKGVALDNLGRYEDAIASYDAALSIKPNDPEVLCNKGIALSNLGRYEDAIASYDAALSIKPNDPEALYNKGVALSHLDRYEDANASMALLSSITML